MNWGRVEHDFENKTVWMLTLAGLSAVLFFVYRCDWLAYPMAGMVLLTEATHMVARMAHLLEKRRWKRASWSPRGGRKK